MVTGSDTLPRSHQGFFVVFTWKKPRSKDACCVSLHSQCLLHPTSLHTEQIPNEEKIVQCSLEA